MTEHGIGVDISKSHLDVFRLEDDAAQRFENSAAGLRSLKKWLGTAAVARIVFEPTGPYHKVFETALSEKFPLVKVNPLQARRFAEAYGTRAKTDAVDAQMLARMGAAFNLEPQEPCSKETLVPRDLHVARAGLIKDRTRLRNRAQTQDIPLLKRQTKARLTQVERQIAELDAENADPVARDRYVAAQTGGQPDRSCTHHPTIRSMAGKVIHRRRAQTPAQRPLHASLGRDAVQPGSEGQI
jgi:transposase